jgi:hypothetical protein
MQHSLWAREWRKQQPARSLDDATPMPPDPDKVVEQMQVSIASSTKRRRAAKQRHPAHNAEAGWGGAVDTADPTAADQAGVSGRNDAPADSGQIADYQPLRVWLQGRIDDIGDNDSARAALVHLWPRDIPTLRSSDAHTFEQLCIIEGLCDDIEKSHSLGFPTARPGSREDDAAIARVVQMFPGTTISNDQGATKP